MTIIKINVHEVVLLTMAKFILGMNYPSEMNEQSELGNSSA